MTKRPDAPDGADPFENDDSIPLLTDVVVPGAGESRAEAQAAAAIAATGPVVQPHEARLGQAPLPPPLPEPQPETLAQVDEPRMSATPTAPTPTAEGQTAEVMPPAPVMPATSAAAAAAAPPTVREPEPHEWAELAARIEHGVTSRMLEQAGPMLEASLQSMVSPLIEQAAVQIAQDLHDAFSHLVRDLVARALAEELALLQARDLASVPDDDAIDTRAAASSPGATSHSAPFRASPP